MSEVQKQPKAARMKTEKKKAGNATPHKPAPNHPWRGRFTDKPDEDNATDERSM
ncbi:MAG: hypothetical protein Q4D58_04090 [Synergistaceae bacterium]|nr:hypothetical protein [Synergistaceae bacterium]